MKVVIDTVIWSLALRRTEPDEHVCQELARLIEEQRVLLPGPIRQEILSGYSEESRFERLRKHLSCFDNEPVLDEDYIRAAQYHNLCRRRGIQGSHIDFLICSCAFRLQAAIYTRDQDFQQYSKVLPVLLHQENRS
ncbi:MAG: PIN domain-containing protein [Candidatus Electrothrix sp. YB6]